jgi:hypothetical protein
VALLVVTAVTVPTASVGRSWISLTAVDTAKQVDSHDGVV